MFSFYFFAALTPTSLSKETNRKQKTENSFRNRPQNDQRFNVTSNQYQSIRIGIRKHSFSPPVIFSNFLFCFFFFFCLAASRSTLRAPHWALCRWIYSPLEVVNRCIAAFLFATIYSAGIFIYNIVYWSVHRAPPSPSHSRPMNFYLPFILCIENYPCLLTRICRQTRQCEQRANKKKIIIVIIEQTKTIFIQQHNMNLALGELRTDAHTHTRIHTNW